MATLFAAFMVMGFAVFLIWVVENAQRQYPKNDRKGGDGGGPFFIGSGDSGGGCGGDGGGGGGGGD